MLGVTRIPAKYRLALLRFKDAFRESQNYSSFAALACALIATQRGWTVTDLTDVISRPDEKSRRAYDGFFTDATWNVTDLSQLLIEYICDQLRVDQTDGVPDIVLSIDDTFDRKLMNQRMDNRVAKRERVIEFVTQFNSTPRTSV